MGSLGGIWGMLPFDSQNGGHQNRRRKSSQNDNNLNTNVVSNGNTSGGWFPMKQAATAATLALTGDTIAQLREKWVNNKSLQNHLPNHDSNQDVTWSLLDHNWLRALRMASYGFLLYGPGSYVWYQYLDRWMPQQTPQNVLIKVVLNQIILGPSVIAVIFAWNNLWQGKLSELPNNVINFWYLSFLVASLLCNQALDI
nr:protein Mpv17 [Tanacetum cinerariifolium]